jgi:hypothetical protein
VCSGDGSVSRSVAPAPTGTVEGDNKSPLAHQDTDLDPPAHPVGPPRLTPFEEKPHNHKS